MHVRWSVILVNRFGPAILTMLEIERQVLHRVHAHLKVPGWLLDLNAHQTRNLPVFFAVFEWNKWCWRKYAFSFGIIVENFKVFKNDFFDCKVVRVKASFFQRDVSSFDYFILFPGLSASSILPSSTTTPPTSSPTSPTTEGKQEPVTWESVMVCTQTFKNNLYRQY